MHKSRLILIPAFFTLICSFAQASTELRNIGVYKVGFSQPENWTPVTGLYGIPFSLLNEPNKTNERASIGVYDLTLNGVEFDYTELRASTKDYYRGRKKWLSELEGSKYLNDLPFEQVSGSHEGVSGYRIGYRYQLRGVTFTEYSYYLSCNKRMFHLKALAPESPEDQSVQKIASIVKSFQCEPDFESAREFRKISPSMRDEILNNPEKKIQAIKALKQFFIEYEAAHVDAYTYQRSKIRSVIEQFLGYPEANAKAGAVAEGQECFFGGWVSEWVKKDGRLTCEFPSSNPKYGQYVAAAGCKTSEILCNPSLFGANLCANIVTEGQKGSATMSCETEFKKNKRSEKDVAAAASTDNELMKQTLDAANNVCTEEPYLSSNFGLCSTLMAQLKDAGNDTSSIAQAHEQMKPSDYEKYHDQAEEDLAAFESICIDEKGELRGEVTTADTPPIKVDCVAEAKRIKRNLRKLERITPKDDLKKSQEEACYTPDVLGGTQKNVEDAMKAAGSCSAQVKAQNNAKCGSDIQCVVESTMMGPGLGDLVQWITKNSTGVFKPKGCNFAQDGCGKQMISAIISSLWGLIKGVGQLVGWVVDGVVSGVKNAASWVGHKIMSWFGATDSVENQTSTKAHQTAQTTPSQLSQFLHDPFGYIGNMVTGIWNGIKDWIKTDVFCEKWTGVPHMSTCSQPLSDWDCIDCKTALTGTCSIVGYVAAEFVPALLTGGGTALAENAGRFGARITEFLGKSARGGKLLEKTAELTSKFKVYAKLAKETKAVKLGTRMAKGVAEGTKLTAKTLGKGLRFMKGSAEFVAKKLDGLLSKTWLTRAPTRLVKNVVFKVRDKAVKFGDWYVGVQKKSYRLGYEMFGGGRTANRALAKISTAAKIENAVEKSNRLKGEVQELKALKAEKEAVLVKNPVQGDQQAVNRAGKLLTDRQQQLYNVQKKLGVEAALSERVGDEALKVEEIKREVTELETAGQLKKDNQLSKQVAKVEKIEQKMLNPSNTLREEKELVNQHSAAVKKLEQDVKNVGPSKQNRMVNRLKKTGLKQSARDVAEVEVAPKAVPAQEPVQATAPEAKTAKTGKLEKLDEKNAFAEAPMKQGKRTNAAPEVKLAASAPRDDWAANVQKALKKRGLDDKTPFIRWQSDAPRQAENAFLKNAQATYGRLSEEFNHYPEIARRLKDEKSFKEWLQEGILSICFGVTSRSQVTSEVLAAQRYCKDPANWKLRYNDEFIHGASVGYQQRMKGINSYLDSSDFKKTGLSVRLNTEADAIKLADGTKVGLYGDLNRRFYLDGEVREQVFESARKLMNTAVAAQDQEVMLNSLSDYYHMMSHTRPFAEGNNSLFMSQVNALLNAKGLKPVSQHILDHMAHSLDFDEFRKVFKYHVQHGLPETGLSGLGFDKKI